MYIQMADEIDRSNWRINGEEDDVAGAVPNDAVLTIKEFGWGKTKQQFDKIVDVAGLRVDYDPLVFGEAVVCHVENTSGTWEGKGALPFYAYCRAVARFVHETKFNKKQIA